MSPLDPTIANDGPIEEGPTPHEVPVSFSGYHIIEEIGRGGMGIVYRARQLSLNRVVALKMVRSVGKAGPAELERFRAEAEAVAKLQHANIVQVFEVGEHDGKPFFTLEYCPNGNLSKKLAGQPIPCREAAELVIELARAMELVHSYGIVHRDLKPANVLMAADGTPKVTDFGIAKTTSAEEGHTHTGAILGTPSYMAPEQAEGLSKDVGPEADVWALGAILYECLTGRPPFLGATPVETMRQVIDQDPVPPRLLTRLVDPDMEKIVLKCLEKDPGLRYRTAAELAEDLQRFCDGEPIRARSINLVDRLQRELGRSQHEARISPYGNGLMLLGLIIFLVHSATSLMLAMGAAETPAFWLPRTGLVLILIVWMKRYGFGTGFLPTNALERMMWAVWLGYLLAFSAIYWVMRAQGHGHLEMYGPAFALGGLAWFAMGGVVWGGCYVIGLLHMIAAPLASLLDGQVYAPAVFGAAWGVTLLVVGGRYRLRTGETTIDSLEKR